MDDTSGVSPLKSRRPNEALFEETTIERLEQLTYAQASGPVLREDPAFPEPEVVLKDTLRAFLAHQYPHLDDLALETALRRAANPEGVSLLQRNMAFHQMLTRGFDTKYERKGGIEAHEHVYLVDWNEAQNNTFQVVSQLTIQGKNRRRPDLIVYVNGLPLVVFELKNPYDDDPTVVGAHNQIQHYTRDIPQLFDYNAFCVISDGATTLHGMFFASMEWFAPWKSIDGRTAEQATTGTMKTLIEGLFPKDRLLAYIRHFIVHEVVHDEITKKGAKYHQFFGVRFAVERALEATEPDGDRKIGVIWHTQGSGKSLSMVFFVGILRQRLYNPTILVQVDRTDLDEQLYDAFVAARALVGTVEHADSVDDLRTLLMTEGGGVVFTTIEKFRLREEELAHPVLSERRNIIVIADEAHRTQYGFTGKIRRTDEGERYTAYGYAQYLRQALPNASFIGFTGTPIDESDRDTVSVFGDVIHTYDIPQAQADGAIVPIYYEARLVELRLVNDRIDEELEEITEGNEVEREKARWAALEAAAGTQERLARLAQDILAHFEERRESLLGKGIIVCMSRRICVALYDEIARLRPAWHDPRPDQGQVKVVMTGNITKDPAAWNDAGHITTKDAREQIKQRFRNPDDPLRLVIVRDMWLTGTDIPCLTTLYVDKPMRGHSLMQALARVNRVFENKPGGLVVDYIGIGTELKAATEKYTRGGFGEPTEALEEAAMEQFSGALGAVRATLPEGVTVADWPTLSNIAFEDLCQRLYGHYTLSDETRDDYLHREKRLSAAFSLVSHLPEAQAAMQEVAFYQMVRGQLAKTLPQAVITAQEREQAVRDLIDRSIAERGVVDIFAAAGLERPEISILDDAFLKEFASTEQAHLRVRLLEKLLGDDIQLRRRSNLAKYRSFQDRLEATLERYHAGAITAAEVIQAMMEIRREALRDDERKKELGLSDEELAFYDAIQGLQDETYDMPFVRDLVHEVVETVKRNLRVDWTKPHRENVKSGVQAAVKRVLRNRRVKRAHFQFILSRVMKQAEEMYRDWPLSA